MADLWGKELTSSIALPTSVPMQSPQAPDVSFALDTVVHVERPSWTAASLRGSYLSHLVSGTWTAFAFATDTLCRKKRNIQCISYAMAFPVG